VPKEFALLEFLMRNAGQPVSNYLRRKVDSGYDRPLIRTVRGTGCQIGTNGYLSKNAVA
jgi:DNA-binding response OmpR family regulator